MKEAGKKGGLGILMAGVTVMGALLGWIAYADEIGTDVATTAIAIGNATNNVLPMDPSAVQLINLVRQTVEGVHNSSVMQELYGASTNVNGVAGADVVLADHFTNYCGLLDGPPCTLDPLLMYGDMKISSLLSGTVYDGSRQQAAQIYLSNLLDPPAVIGVANFNADMPVNVATLANSPKTKAAFVQAVSDEAMVSIIREPFANMMAIRMPPPANGSNPPGPSQMQMMEEVAMQRFMSSAWATSMTLPTTTPQQIMAQQAMMQAYQVWMSYQQYRQMERVEALLSVLALQNFRQQKATAAQVSQAQNSSAAANTSSSSSSTSGQ